MVIFFGMFYVAVMLSYVYQIRVLENGLYLAFLIFICSWGCDTCAYCVGVLIGKHKMAPILSPKKSIEGAVGGVVALLGIVAAPITSGDTALRSARLILADFLHMEQRSIKRRLLICIPLFLVTMATLIYSLADADGFKIIWRYFAWSNQTLSVFTLWAITVYLVQEKKPYWITLIPALFMTCISITYISMAPEGFGLPAPIGYAIGAVAVVTGIVWFRRWIKRQSC